MAILCTERRMLADLSLDFWTFWSGQAISTLGSSFTGFAIPLLIFKLTGSALNLSLSMAISYLPSVVLGLLVGAWVDRMNRKRVMLVVNGLMALNVGSIPLLALSGHLTIGWIYGMLLVNATLRLFFTSASFAAIPSLVPNDRLIAANGQIQASYSAMTVVGPLLAGALVAFVPLESLLTVDSASYLVAGAALLLVRGSFNTVKSAGRLSGQQHIRADILEGLRFIFTHPVLRNISIMMAIVNFFSLTVASQLVYFAKVQLHAANTQVGLLFSASAVGVFTFSLLAGPLRRHWPFSRVALGLLEIQGVVTILMAQMHWYWAVLPLFALWQGLGNLFSLNTTTLRQVLTPNHMLGRVVMTASVLGGSVIPLGTVAGGLAIERTGNISLVFTVIGAVVFLVPIIFSFTALGHAERYLPLTEAAHGSDRGPVGEWVEEAASLIRERVEPVHPAGRDPGPFDVQDLEGCDLQVIRAGLESIYSSSRDITRLMQEMAETKPSTLTLEALLQRLSLQVEDIEDQWGEIESRVRHQYRDEVVTRNR